MKKIQLLSVVFSLAIFAGITAGSAVAFAESDGDDHDFDDRLESFCEMTDAEKEQLFLDHPRLAPFEERITNFCELDEMEREDLIDEFIEENFPNYVKQDDWDMDDILDRYCEMSTEDKSKFLEKYPMTSDHQEKMEEYCLLDESEREDFIDEHKDEYGKGHDYDLKAKLDRFCEMSEEDKKSLQEKYPMASDHQEKMEEYCLLDELERDAFIEEHKDKYAKNHSYNKLDYNIREKMDGFCELSDKEKADTVLKHQKSEEHLKKMEEYCSLDDSGRNAFIEEHNDDIKNKMSDHKDWMTDKMCDAKDGIGCENCRHEDGMGCKMSEHKASMKGEMSRHDDSMKSTMSDHKNSMSFQKKSHMILRASTLTDEQKDEIKAVHEELREFKHSLRDKSMSDGEKQEIRNQFMEKAKEFSMTWLSPRHQAAAGIDANMIECREGFTLVMKTSNASPICVKETTAEKLIERGIVISSL